MDETKTPGGPTLRVIDAEGDTYIHHRSGGALSFEDLTDGSGELLPHLPELSRPEMTPRKPVVTFERAPGVKCTSFDDDRPTLYTFDWELLERYHPWQWSVEALGAKLGFKLSRDDTKIEAAEAARRLEAALTEHELDYGALHGLLAQAVEAIDHLDERPIFRWLKRWHRPLSAWGRRAFELDDPWPELREPPPRVEIDFTPPKDPLRDG